MRVALTYDDGPSQWTPAILDLLAEAGAHATFFVPGCYVEGREDVLRQILKDGHAIGIHGWDHTRVSLISRNHLLMRHLWLSREELWGATGHTASLWRAPHLDLDDEAEEVANRIGLTHVGCDIDTADWMLDDPQRIADAALRAKDGDIILMHDGIPPDGGTGTKTRQPTVDALRIILRQPWEFLTVSALWESTRAA